MRKLLAVALMGGALIVSISAAVASDDTGIDQSGVAQNAQLSPYPLPPQPPKPFVSITIPV